MKAINLVRLVCISCVCYSAAEGENDEVNAGKPDGDDPIKVTILPRERGSGIRGCLKASVTSCSIRFQSLKTSGGSMYSRQLVTAADLPCFVNSVTKDLPAVTNMADCAEATAREGLNSFLWEGGACTAFLAWRPRTRADCKDGGSKVVYVVEELLTPFARVVRVSGRIHYHVPQVNLYISSHQYCGFHVNVSKGYKLQWNGTEEVLLPEGTTRFNLDRKLLCFISTNLSLWSIGADGNVNSNEQQVSIDRGESRWYGLRTGSCIHLGKKQKNGDGVVQDCRSLALPTVFSEKIDGEAAAFLMALNASDEIPKGSYHVGLHRNGSDWFWTGGLEQPVVDAAVWGPGQPVMTWAFQVYGMVQYENGKWSIASVDNSKVTHALCYVSNP